MSSSLAQQDRSAFHWPTPLPRAKTISAVSGTDPLHHSERANPTLRANISPIGFMQKATRHQTKEHNTTLVLRAVYQHNRLSRADLARITGLTKTTVSDIVGDLIEEGLVAEIGPAATPSGKPPIHVELIQNARQILCLDLSGDEFRGTLVNLRGEVQHRMSLPLNGCKGESAYQMLLQLVDALTEEATAPILGAGIGASGQIDTQQGIIHWALPLEWFDYPLKQRLEERYPFPVHIANDSQIAALAEFANGPSIQEPNLALIRVGESIGSGIVMGGQLQCGDGHSTGAIGHLSVEPNGPPCDCGNQGCLEAMASGPAMWQRILETMGRKEAMRLVAESGSGEGRFVQIQRMFAAGNDDVRSIVLEAGKHLGTAIASLAGILNIHRIALAGIPVGFGDRFIEAVKEGALSRLSPSQAIRMQIGFSKSGPDIVLHGASALVLKQELDLT